MSKISRWMDIKHRLRCLDIVREIEEVKIELAKIKLEVIERETIRI